MPQILDISALYNDANLQEYYQLESTSGKNGNTLTNNNTVAFNSAKFSNGADGGSSNTNKYLNVASALGYTNGAYGISLWVKLNTEISSGTYDLVELAESTTDTSLIISYGYNGGTRRIELTHLRAGVAVDQITYNVTLGTSVFHHIVFTSSGNGGTLKGYVDNVATSTATHTATAGSGLTSGFTILDGRSAPANPSSAIVDDVALFNREITAAEVNTIYTDVVTGNNVIIIS